MRFPETAEVGLVVSQRNPCGFSEAAGRLSLASFQLQGVAPDAARGYDGEMHAGEIMMRKRQQRSRAVICDQDPGQKKLIVLDQASPLFSASLI